MRGILGLLVVLGLNTPAWAGLYNSPDGHPDVSVERIRPVVGQLRAVAQEPKGPLDPVSPRAGYLRQAEALEEILKNGTLSEIERADLGACYIRLGRIRDAVRLLSAGDRQHFLVQANLATAHHLNGDPELAVRCQERVLMLWPDVWAGWKKEHLEFYLECERAYLRLLRHRLDESRLGRTGTPLDIDPLFPGFRLPGPKEQPGYEPGQLPQQVMDKLPPRAFAVTRQLVLWLPQDPRLYWLLAELLNAGGQVDVAYDILWELVYNGMGEGVFRNIMRHRTALEGPARILRQLRRSRVNGEVLSALLLVPRPTLAPGVAGAAAYQSAAVVAEVMGRIAERPPDLPALPVTETSTSEKSGRLPFNWRHVSVGFAFGFLVAALLAMQMQEWRRRLARPTVPTDQNPASPPT